MVTRRTGGVSTKRSRLVVLALAIAALWPAADSRAQLPMPSATVFEMTGFIQQATLDAGTDPFRGGTITLNNHKVVVPRYTVFQMPATALTWAELFSLAPASYQANAQTGLALTDTPKPDFTFEVTVQGNRVVDANGDRYVAGLIFISNLSVQAHQGFISKIDYATGELTVGGARVRLNDPNVLAPTAKNPDGTPKTDGRFGRAMSPDVRFKVDQDNPTVKSETGYPMCIPRVDPATADDPLCPQGNRPAGQSIFTMATPPPPTAAQFANPALRDVDATGKRAPVLLDPWREAPFEIGDYVTVKGPVVYERDASGKVTGQYISAFAIDANLGIFTTPGTQPTYVSIDVILMGTGPVNDVTLAQEGAKRTRVEGFTTDIATPVQVSALDVNACTGEQIDRLWNVEAVDPGPPTGAVQGRWRFRPGAPLFDLKGFPFLPPTREVHAVSLNGTPIDSTGKVVATMNGLTSGQYQAPNFEFILPENLGIGSPMIPANFENMPFLVQGSGPWRGGAYTGQLSPWPGSAVAARNACAVVSPSLTVMSGATATLDGSPSVAANAPNGAVTYQWTQLSGTSVSLTNANTPVATFTAPQIPVGSTTTLTFKLTATSATSTVDSTPVIVTVVNPDTVAPKIDGGVTLSLNPPQKGKALTIYANTVSDNVGVTAVTFTYTANAAITPLPAGCTNTTPSTTTCTAPAGVKTSTAGQWSSGSSTGFVFPNYSNPSGLATVTWTFTAKAVDAAGNAATASTTATVR